MKPRDWSREPLTAVQKFILETHHVYTHATLEALLDLADDAAPQRVAALVEQLYDDLIPHMTKEEQILFPYIEELELSEDAVEPSFGTVENPIRMMVKEHEAATDLLLALRRATNGYRPPDGATAYVRELYEKLAALEDDLLRHIDLENNVLFPRAAALEAKLRDAIVRTY